MNFEDNRSSLLLKMPIIHVRISYNSVTLKDWEGLPVEKETKMKDFLMIYQFHVCHLISGKQILKCYS